MTVRISKSLFRFWLPAFAVLVAVGIYQSWSLVSGAVPEISAETLDGKPFSQQQFRGKPYLVHFWASWCGICRFEEKSIAALSKDYQVITIAMQSGDAAEVRAYLRQRGLDMPVIVDEQGALARRFGVRGVPSSFVVDGQGEIRAATRGYTSSWGLKLRLWYAGWF